MIMLLNSLVVGCVVALIAWQTGSFLSRVPSAQRHYFDQPAFGFRVVWPLIRILVFYSGPLITETHREGVSLKLKQAGVEFMLSAEEYICGQCVSALVVSVCFAALSGSAGMTLLWLLPLTSLAGYQYPNIWLREKTKKRQTEIFRALPFYLDVITLAVESGTNLTGGMTQAVKKTADSPLRREISRVLRDIRSGKSRAEALREFETRTASPAVGQIVSGLLQAEKTGSSLGPMLRVQSEQLRNQRFQQAEKKAMEAPVKLLGPLFVFIFPTTFLTLGFIFISKAIMEGFITWPPVVWAYGWPGVS
ncbi:MAG: type II secretion system F family protein [Granulosicoccus sp.]